MITNLPKYLDFANHHANATKEDIEDLCKKVIQYGFNGAFVNPIYISFAKKLVDDKAKVGTVISFPLGQETLDVKIASSQQAAKAGADELDVVANLGLLLEDPRGQSYLSELSEIVKHVKEIDSQKIVKFILETGYMTDELIKKGAECIVEAGADFVKICSGMGPRGASVEDVKLIRATIGDLAKIKAAGGIDTYEEAVALIDAGANRLGTSKAIEIVTHASNQTEASKGSAE